MSANAKEQGSYLWSRLRLRVGTPRTSRQNLCDRVRHSFAFCNAAHVQQRRGDRRKSGDIPRPRQGAERRLAVYVLHGEQQNVLSKLGLELDGVVGHV